MQIIMKAIRIIETFSLSCFNLNVITELLVCPIKYQHICQLAPDVKEKQNKTAN